MYPSPARREIYGLPMYSQNAATETSYSGQSAVQTFQFDGLPRATEQSFMTSPVNSVPQQYTLPSQIVNPQTPMSWSDPTQSFDDMNTSDFYGHYSPNIADSPHGSAIFRSNVDTEIPRFTPGQGNIRFFGEQNSNNNSNMMDPYNPQSSLYLPETSPSKHGESSSNHQLHQPQSDSSYLDNVNSPSSLPRERFSRLSVSRSPIPSCKAELRDVPNFPLFASTPPFRLPSSKDSSSAGVSSREMTAVVEAEDEAEPVEEPYAKLIYRALMSTPSHSMVLQEIYQWFRENTVKGMSDTKGWMNSIRHNLSMNAAFKKTERKMQGDDAKKSTEWVLEPFAIKDGVQSTTRYRKGTGSKKFHRSGTPAPSRQASGHKGGTTAARIKLQRQNARLLEMGFRRVDENRREEFHRYSRNEISRRRSPLTPPHPADNAPSMYDVGMKEDYESPLPYSVNSDDYGTFEDTQGVYLEDTSPLFIGAQEMSYHYGLQDPAQRD